MPTSLELRATAFTASIQAAKDWKAFIEAVEQENGSWKTILATALMVGIRREDLRAKLRVAELAFRNWLEDISPPSRRRRKEILTPMVLEEMDQHISQLELQLIQARVAARQPAA